MTPALPISPQEPRERPGWYQHPTRSLRRLGALCTALQRALYAVPSANQTLQNA
jgi:hypothetical protein